MTPEGEGMEGVSEGGEWDVRGRVEGISEGEGEEGVSKE